MENGAHVSAGRVVRAVTSGHPRFSRSEGRDDASRCHVEGVQKVYGDTVAVDGCPLTSLKADLRHHRTERCRKTTLIECIEGLRRPDAGLFASRPRSIADAYELRERIASNARRPHF